MMATACLVGAVLYAQTPPVAQTPPAVQPVPTAAGNGTNNPTMTQPAALATANEPLRVKIDDKKWIKNAALGGIIEIELGKLAAEKATSDGLKQFGQKMVEDHGQVNSSLKQIAARDNVVIAEALDVKRQKRLDKLAKLSGAAFDKAYVKDQLNDHEADVRKFKLEAELGTDASVKEFAVKTLPVLEQHLSMIKGLEAQHKNASKEKQGARQ